MTRRCLPLLLLALLVVASCTTDKTTSPMPSAALDLPQAARMTAVQLDALWGPAFGQGTDRHTYYRDYRVGAWQFEISFSRETDAVARINGDHDTGFAQAEDLLDALGIRGTLHPVSNPILSPPPVWGMDDPPPPFTEVSTGRWSSTGRFMDVNAATAHWPDL